MLAHPAVWLSSQLPYAPAGQVLKQIGGYSLPATSLWEQTQQTGAAWLAQPQDDYVSVERTRWETPAYQAQVRQSVSLDGGRVQVRGEGWKEFKVGVIGRLLAPWELAEGEQVGGQHLRYTAVLGGGEAFSKVLWQFAVQQPVP
jgi:hypothetical protein